MKPYGNDRIENLTCYYKCCHGIYIRTKWYKPSKKVKRRSRSRARQLEKKELRLWLCSSSRRSH